jgi:erythronate-4-phosphate dehydrogenase
MIKIIADDKIPFLEGVLEPYAQVKYLPGRNISQDEIKNADALLIRTRTRCTRELLKGTGVKFIGTATIGFDHIDTGYCELNNIKWVNAPGCNSSSVQQYIAAALFKISREFRFSLKDKTIGIIGAGNVGEKVEKFCNLLGMKVLVNDPPRARKEGNEKFTELNALLKESDIITLHVPLSFVGEDKTFHMINEKSLRKMKKGAWLINTSRGEVAETLSLKKARSSGRLSGIVADVWENEPAIDSRLMQLSFIATPHIAGYSTDGKANGTSIVVNELARFFNIPLKDWYPEKVPAPSYPEIALNGRDKDTEETVRIAVEHTYNISEDDLKLRFSPSDFEKLRGDYPVRREFPAYTVNLEGSTVKTKKIIESLGFVCK